MVYDQTEKKHKQLMRKNPADYADEQWAPRHRLPVVERIQTVYTDTFLSVLGLATGLEL